MKPFFSIVMATYNRAYCIENAINSVLKQNFKDWELIIVDDGSTDNTQEVIKKYLNNKRIKYIKLKKNSGVNVARNKGYIEAKGEWLFDLDSDNWLSEKGLEDRFIEVKKVNFDMIKFLVKTPKEEVLKPKNYKVGFLDYKDIVCGKNSGEFTTVIKTDLMKKYMWFEDINGGEAITWELIAKDLGRVYFSDKVVLVYNNEGEDRLSIRSENIDRIYKIYKKQLEVLGKEYIKICPRKFFNILIRVVAYKVKLWFS